MMAEVPNMAIMIGQQVPGEVPNSAAVTAQQMPADAPAQEPVPGSSFTVFLESFRLQQSN